jgi:3-deoxy-D-manno-octulosonic-acid transferase
MTSLLYTLAIRLYSCFIAIAAWFNPKAKQWIDGRRDWRRRYAGRFEKRAPVLWVHAASLGEFEQGRPIIEAWRERCPDWQIVLTFFSPSGYQIRQHYAHADFIAYLPADTPRNAADFLELIRPDAAVFVKYEFWANYLFALRRRGVPTLLVSALFRPGQPFFRPWGGFWRGMLRTYDVIFVQNEASAALLRTIGIEHAVVGGDTRVDRVVRLAAQAPENAVVRAFAGAAPVLVVGSSWAADEAVVLEGAAGLKPLKIVIAPHEPSAAHLAELEKRLGQSGWTSARYSRATVQPVGDVDVLVIDNVGMLNTLYRYGRVAYIGGGFGKGIHNTLEPAAYGLPVLFGPKYEKFEEARAFVARGGGFAVGSAGEFAAVLQRLLSDAAAYDTASRAVLHFLDANRGATALAVNWLAQRVS